MKKICRDLCMPPTFEGDEEKNNQARLLHGVILSYVLVILIVIIGNLLGGRVPVAVYGLDGLMLGVFLYSRFLLLRGKVSFAGFLFIFSSITLLTFVLAILGTIRTPATTAYVLIIIIAGMLFDKKGLLLSFFSSSFMILGLMLAERKGLLPSPDFTVNITQWVAYSVIFALAGWITYFSRMLTNNALTKMEREAKERKEAEDALRESEERYRILVEKNPIAIIVHDAEGEILYANPASLEVFNAPDFNTIKKKHVFDYIHPDYIDASKERLRRIAGEKNSTAPFRENKLLRLGGQAFDAEVAGNTITYQGELAIQIFILDISERKKAEAERQEALNLLQRTMDGIPEPVMYIGLDYKLKNINRSAREQLKLKSADITSTYCHQLCRERDASKSDREYPCPVTQVRATLQPATVTHEYIQENGSARTVEVVAAPIFDEAQNLNGFIETHRDISDRIQADQTIRQLSRVVEQSASTIVITDLEGNIEFTNPAFTKVTGYTAEEILGENPRILKSGETDAKVYEDMWSTLTKGDIWRGEFLNKKKNDELYWESVIISPVKDEQGNTTHFVAIKDDITARKKIELSLNESEEKFRSVVEQSRDGISLVNQFGKIIEWNRGMTQITGLKREDVLGKYLWDIIVLVTSTQSEIAKMGEQLKTTIQKLLRNTTFFKMQRMIERPIQHVDGEMRIMQSIIYPITTNRGSMIGIISRDVTDIKKIEKALLESEEKYRSIVEQSRDGIIIIDQSGNIIEWNRAMEKITGLSHEDVTNMSLWKTQSRLVPNERRDVVTEERIEAGIHDLLDHIDLLKGRDMEERLIQRPDGSIRTMQSMIYPIITKNKMMVGVTSRDVTEQKKAEAELHKLAQAVNSSGSSILITDLDGKIEFVNAAFSEVSGYLEKEIIGKNPRVLKSGKTDPKVYAELWGTLQQGKIWRGELLNRKKNGELYWDFLVISPITDKDGKITHYVAVRDDITERKKEKEHLAYIATHDILTKLPNRSFFNERLEHALTLARRNHWQVALFFIDLNDFKLINDRFGHNAGDDALIEFGKRLRESVRDSDTVARLGGDEFACLLENIPSKERLFSVIEKITKNLEQPFYIGDKQEIQLSASIGVSIYPQDAENSSLLLGGADYAMYEAKKKKGEGCCSTVFVT